MDKLRTPSLLAWLGSNPQGADVLATARRLLSAEQDVRQALPPALAACCRVSHVQEGRLSLSVPGVAHAAKLRQMAPRILAQLRQRGWQFESVQVKVQAGSTFSAPRPPRETEALNAQALQAFDELRAGLPAGPLADAISRLLERHRP